MRVSGINHVGITTTDIDRAKRFYGDLLGLELRGAGEDPPSPTIDRLVGLQDVHLRWAEYHLGGGQILELLQYVTPPGEPVAQRPNAPGSGHLAFEVDDIDAIHEKLDAVSVPMRSSAPVQLEEEGPWRGYRCLYAEDPDGFIVEFVQCPDGRQDG